MKRFKLTTFWLGLFLLGVTTVVWAAHKVVKGADQLARDAIKQAGAVTCVIKAPYSRSIPQMYIGRDANGKAVAGVALRAFKSYEVVTTMLLVKRTDAGMVIEEVTVPDIAVIKKEDKRKKVTGALEAFSGNVIRKGDKGDVQKIDAVTGATRYQKRIYAYVNDMAAKIVAEMDKPSPDADWKNVDLK